VVDWITLISKDAAILLGLPSRRLPDRCHRQAARGGRAAGGSG